MYCVLCRPSLPFLVLPFLDFVSLPAKEKGVPYLEVFWCEFSKKGSALSILSLCFQHPQRHEEPKSPATSTITQLEWVQNTYKATVRSSLASARFAYSGARRYSTGRVTAVRSCSRRSCIRFQIFPIAFCCSGVCRLQNLKHAACTRARSTGVTKYCTAARGMRYVARSWHSCTTLCTAASAWQPVWRAPYSVWGRAMPQWHVCS